MSCGAEVAPVGAVLLWIGAGCTLLWYAFATLYLALTLLGDQCGPFFRRWGPATRPRRLWWQIALWGGLLLVAGVIALGQNYPTAVFLTLIALFGGIVRVVDLTRPADTTAD